MTFSWETIFVGVVLLLTFQPDYASLAGTSSASDAYEKVLDHEYSFATPLLKLIVKSQDYCHSACSNRRDCKAVAFGRFPHQTEYEEPHNCVLLSNLQAFLTTQYLENWTLYKRVNYSRLVEKGNMNAQTPVPLRELLIKWCVENFASSAMLNPLFDGTITSPLRYSWRCYKNDGFYMDRTSNQYGSKHSELVQVIRENQIFSGNLAAVSQSCTSRCEEKGKKCLLHADTVNSVWYFWNAGKKCLHNLDEKDIWSTPGEPYYNPSTNKCHGWINPRATYTSCGIIIEGMRRLCFCG